MGTFLLMFLKRASMENEMVKVELSYQRRHVGKVPNAYRDKEALIRLKDDLVIPMYEAR